VQAATATPSRPRALLAGQRRFSAGERIGPELLACEPLGGDGRIERWLAWSQQLWTQVVVELPRDEHADDLRTVRRLAREARALRRLSHPAIPRLLEDRHDHPLPHLVLEHVRGRTLDQVRADGPLPAAQVARLGVQLAACLRHVHTRGLAHLPLEAPGIILRSGQPVLLHAGAVRDLRRCDPHLDLIALGVLLHQVVAHPVPPELDAALAALRGCRPGADLDAVGLLAAALPPDAEAAWPQAV
jgi:serine/threonine protein kinase